MRDLSRSASADIDLNAIARGNELRYTFAANSVVRIRGCQHAWHFATTLGANRLRRTHCLHQCLQMERPAPQLLYDSPSNSSLPMKLRTVTATRYITPLREGGSLPAVVEADDEGVYVLKFSGAGQGPKALIAEFVAGEIARAAGLPVPEIVFVELAADLGRTEPDAEIQALLKASAGLNLALDYLPGSVTFDPVPETPEQRLASDVVAFDAYVTNVDRTARNTNMLMWHRRLQLIDHGAALYMHHSWDNYLERSRDPFPHIKDHVLLPFAATLGEAGETLSRRITPEVIREIVTLIPDSWLTGNSFSTTDGYRDAYFGYLTRRLTPPLTFIEEAIRARSLLV